MNGGVTDLHAVDADQVRKAVDALLEDFLDDREAAAPELGEVRLFTGMLRAGLRAGGKRLRPLLCISGWHAVRADPPPERLLRLAASLELFHIFALIHDDLMDGSESRHGRPTAHLALAERFAGHPRGEALGRETAMLLGDIALSWSCELAYTAPGLTSDEINTIAPVLGALHTETLVGQHLDLAATGRSCADTDLAWRIVRYKTAKYTVERPLHLGAGLAGADSGQLCALSGYAMPLGEAFQLRDDLLGVFGVPSRTGKSDFEDLRSGKHTVLMALAHQRADSTQAAVLRELLGSHGLDAAGAAALREVLRDTGAVDAIEELIEARRRAAAAALDGAPLRDAGLRSLRALADSAVRRTA